MATNKCKISSWTLLPEFWCQRTTASILSSVRDGFNSAANAMSARSLAMSSVAEGRAAASAASFIDCMVSGDPNQELTVSAITPGLLLYFPKPESSTKGTFPSSCPGLKSGKKVEA
jgi:hypothetical protein